MALSIKHPEADRLARELADRTGESITDAVLAALRERVRHLRAQTGASSRIAAELRAARKRLANYPVIDSRAPDDIIGYDESGLPR